MKSHALPLKQASKASHHSAKRCHLEVHLHLETPAKGHFDISSYGSAPKEQRKQSSERTGSSPCSRATTAMLHRPQASALSGGRHVCASAVSGEAGARRAAAAVAVAQEGMRRLESSLVCIQDREGGCTIAL